MLIKVSRSANRIYKTQLKVSKEDTNETGKEHGTFTVLLDERLNEGTRLEAAGNEQPLTGYDGNPFHGYNNPRATVYSPRDTANNPRVTVHATITDEQESDIDDLFAPIARLQTIRPLIALAAGKGWKIHQLGYENDFSKCSQNVNIDDGQSTTGHVFYLGTLPITWCSQKQTTVALSSCEAKFMVATAAACQAIWLRKVLAEVMENDQVIVEHVFRDDQRADPLMKALARKRFKEMRSLLGGQELPSSTQKFRG
ncbi:hypothetical protein Tco_1468658 [Tanacetum coccineum]